MPEVNVTAQDTAGRPVSGATVTMSPDGSLASTNADGEATLRVSAGTYRLRVSHVGFATATREDVQVPEEQDATVRVTLEPE